MTTLIHGDSMDVLDTLEPGSFDAVITDPPYSSGGFTRGDRMSDPRIKYSEDRTSVTGIGNTFTGDNRDQRGYLVWSDLWMRKALRLVKGGGLLMVFADWRQLPVTTDAVQVAGWLWRGVFSWVKPIARPQPGRLTNSTEFVVWASNGPMSTTGRPVKGYWEGSAPSPTARLHLTQKPVALMAHLMGVLPKHARILDPFAGSGTTGEAAQLLGHEFVGVELNDSQYLQADRRLAAGVLPIEVAA